MTLLELMIALTISLIVVLAALAVLLFARSGFTTVDTATQLRENTRFGTELLSRVVLQAGYQQWSETGTANQRSVQRNDASAKGVTVLPDIQGYNNALFDTASAATTANDSRTSGCGSITDTSCVNGSDVLMIRYQGSTDASGKPDGSMIDCSGQAQGAVTAAANVNGGRAISVFYVAVGTSKEPALMCATLDSTGAWKTPVPLVEGVETFQVLYGGDAITPNKDPASLTVPTTSTVTQWLRADQMVVLNNAAGTYRNWQRVRAVRVGVVLRSPTAQAGSAGATVMYPFVDSTVPSTNDPGVALTVPADRRVRQSFSFTITLRNAVIDSPI